MGSEDSECRLLIQTSLNNMSEIIFIIWGGEPRLRGNRGRKGSRTEKKMEYRLGRRENRWSL